MTTRQAVYALRAKRMQLRYYRLIEGMNAAKRVIERMSDHYDLQSTKEDRAEFHRLYRNAMPRGAKGKK